MAGSIATAVMFAVSAWVCFADGAPVVGWVMVAGAALYGLVWLPIEIRTHRLVIDLWRRSEQIRLRMWTP